MSLSLPRNVLAPEDIYKYYREAVIHYSKVRLVIFYMYFASKGIFFLQLCIRAQWLSLLYILFC